jgi:hypothetical protein
MSSGDTAKSCSISSKRAAYCSVPSSSSKSQGRSWILNIRLWHTDRRKGLILEALVRHICMGFLFSSQILTTPVSPIHTVPHQYTVFAPSPRLKRIIRHSITVPLPHNPFFLDSLNPLYILMTEALLEPVRSRGSSLFRKGGRYDHSNHSSL